jgi:hypothetical protein
MRQLVAPFVAAIVAACASGCDPTISSGVGVDNRTSESLHFRVQLEGPRWYSYPSKVPPHERGLALPAPVIPEGGCSAGAMVALDDAEREVARHDAPVCVGDVWIIE